MLAERRIRRLDARRSSSSSILALTKMRFKKPNGMRHLPSPNRFYTLSDKTPITPFPEGRTSLRKDHYVNMPDPGSVCPHLHVPIPGDPVALCVLPGCQRYERNAALADHCDADNNMLPCFFPDTNCSRVRCKTP